MWRLCWALWAALGLVQALRRLPPRFVATSAAAAAATTARRARPGSTLLAQSTGSKTPSPTERPARPPQPPQSNSSTASSFFSVFERGLSDLTTSLGAKLESNLRNTGVAASAASKRASKGMGEMASVFDESIAKPMKDAPSALRTLADPESWNLLQSGLNPLDKPKLIGTFELTSTKQRAKLKRKAPEFEKKPSPVAPEVLLRTVRTLPSKLKYDYELRVKAREKEEAAALNRQLSDGRGVDAEKEGREEQGEEEEEEDEEEDEGEQARRGQMTALSSGGAPPLWSELEAQSIGKQVPISNDAPVAAPVDFMIGSTAINPSAYEDDDDDDDDEEAMQVVDRGGGPVSAAQETSPSVVVAATVLRQVAPGVETPSAATTAAAASVAAPASASPPPPPPPPLIVETTAQTKQILDEEAMKKIGTTAIDVVFFLAETAFKAAAPIVRDGGATAFARLQETLLPDDGMSELRKAEAKRQQQPTSSPSTALGRLNEPRGADASGGSRILGTLSRRTQQQRRP